MSRWVRSLYTTIDCNGCENRFENAFEHPCLLLQSLHPANKWKCWFVDTVVRLRVSVGTATTEKRRITRSSVIRTIHELRIFRVNVAVYVATVQRELALKQQASIIVLCPKQCGDRKPCRRPNRPRGWSLDRSSWLIYREIHLRIERTCNCGLFASKI